MSNSILYVVDEKGENKKLRFYLKVCQKLSTRFILHTAREHKILVNGEALYLNYKVKLNDKIEVILEKDETQDVVGEKMDLDIVYEDEDFIIINKPPNLVVHPTKSHIFGTLANGLIYHFREKGENTIVRLVNRLDMDTSGLIISAKNQFTHSYFSKIMGTKDYTKKYLAICHGILNEKKGIIDLPIYRESEDVIKRTVDERGKESITKYEVVEEFKYASLLSLTILTGRTHQIRIHMEAIGHPIYGDKLYSEFNDEDIISRQALHAYYISFIHPKTLEFIEFKGELPKDMMEAIKKLNV
jgi:23S rRNA pseudouridine1911/1915/1917 synthase